MSTVFDVAIIGYGPAGATLANLLGAYGLSVVVLERETGMYGLPRGVHFDGEVMRVFESAGLYDEVAKIARPGLTGMHFNNAAGETLLIRGGTSAQGPHGHATNYYFHQPELENVLRQGVAHYPNVEVRLGHEVKHFTQNQERVRLQVLDKEKNEHKELHAKYLIGCDGARSPTRRTIGASTVDLGLQQAWLVFDVRLRGEVASLPTHTVQLCDPARPMTYCNVTGNRRRWEIMIMPGDDPAELVRPETLWRLVKDWVSPEQAEIERAVIYTFESMIAQKWHEGRVFIAGDAAHLTPPFLGQGMCAAIRDASNLAWKLKAVLVDGVDEHFLSSYGAERAPHVQTFIELAVKLGGLIQTTDPVAAAERDAKFKAGKPEIFEFPVPRLGTGLWQGEHAAVGRIFPQPRLKDGRLLDAHLGQQFALLISPHLLLKVGDDSRRQWQKWGLVVLPAIDPELQHWLTQQEVQAVFLRPDRYVLGVAKEHDDLLNLTHYLQSIFY